MSARQTETNGHDHKGRFLPGNKGGGRPRAYHDFRAQAKAFMDVQGIGHLLNMAAQQNEFALKLLAEYAYGKPQQHMDITTLGETIKAYVGVDLERV